jgi:hypothetical protein
LMFTIGLSLDRIFFIAFSTNQFKLTALTNHGSNLESF